MQRRDRRALCQPHAGQQQYQTHHYFLHLPIVLARAGSFSCDNPLLKGGPFMAQGVMAGRVFYAVEYDRKTLQNMTKESERIGKDLSTAMAKAFDAKSFTDPIKKAFDEVEKAGQKVRPPKTNFQPLNVLVIKAREAAAELKLLSDEEKSGAITRDEYREATMRLRGRMQELWSETKRGSDEYDALNNVMARSSTVLDRMARQDVTQRVRELNNEVAALGNGFEKGRISEEEFTSGMRRLMATSDQMAEELIKVNGESARLTTEFRQIEQAGGRAERQLANYEGRITKMGMSKTVLNAQSQLFNRQLAAFGPIGQAANQILVLLQQRYTAAGTAATTGGVGIQFFNQRAAAMAGIVTLGLVGGMVAGSAAIMRLTENTAEWAEQDKVATNRTGLSAEQYQEYAFSANQAGLTTEVMTTILQRLQRRAADAHAGNANLKRSFDQLGVTLTDRNGEMLSTEELLSQVADGLAGVDNNAERLLLTFSILDQAGASALEWLLQGSENIAEMRDRAREMGLVISNEGVQSLFEFGSEADAMRDRFQALGRGLAVEYLPYARDVLDFVEGTGIPVFRTFMGILSGVGRALALGDGQVPQRTAEFIAWGSATAGLNIGLRALLNLIGLASPHMRVLTLVVSAATAAYGLWRANVDAQESALERLNTAIEEHEQRNRDAVEAVDALTEATDKDGLRGAVQLMAATLEGEAKTAFVTLAEQAIASGSDIQVVGQTIMQLFADMRQEALDAEADSLGALARTARAQAEAAGREVQEATGMLDDVVAELEEVLARAAEFGVRTPDMDAVAFGHLPTVAEVQQAGEELARLKLLSIESTETADAAREAWEASTNAEIAYSHALARAAQNRRFASGEAESPFLDLSTLSATVTETGTAAGEAADEVQEFVNTLASLEEKRAELAEARRHAVIGSDEYKQLTTELEEVEEAIRAATARAQEVSKTAAPATTAALRTVQDVFDGIAEAGAHAATRAVALGNTVEAQAESVGTRITLINSGINELISMRLSATDDQAAYLVTAVQELKAELEALRA